MTPRKAAAVLGSYILIQNLESYLITPSVMHHQVKLPRSDPGRPVRFHRGVRTDRIADGAAAGGGVPGSIREVLVHDVLDRWKSKRLTT